MKKPKKSRVESAEIKLYRGIIDTFILPIPYDKKNRKIPSSVECAYNSRYFSPQETCNMLRAL